MASEPDAEAERASSIILSSLISPANFVVKVRFLDRLETMADNSSNEAQADALERGADAVEDMGEAKEEARDDSDLNGHGLSNAEKGAMTNSQ